MLRQELKQCMTGFSRQPDGGCTARFFFPPAFTGFRGHFPDYPVLPGFCLIQAALVLLETAQARAVDLQEVISAKFFAAVTPSLELSIECRASPFGENLATVTAHVRTGDRKIADLSLRVAYGGEES